MSDRALPAWLMGFTGIGFLYNMAYAAQAIEKPVSATVWTPELITALLSGLGTLVVALATAAVMLFKAARDRKAATAEIREVGKGVEEVRQRVLSGETEAQVQAVRLEAVNLLLNKMLNLQDLKVMVDLAEKIASLSGLPEDRLSAVRARAAFEARDTLERRRKEDP